MDRLKLSLGACILTTVLISQLLTTGMTRAAPLTCGSWSVVPSPNPGSLANFLNGVKVVSASNVWAVGYYTNSSGLSQTLIQHWDGTAWSVVPSPNVGSSDNFLYSLAAAPDSSTIWAVGDYINSSNHLQTLIEQWNGTAWSVVPSPNVGLGTNVLFSVTAASASTAVAVGSYTNSSNQSRTLIESWNGTSWGASPGPNVGSNNNGFSSVAAIPGSNWAVGSYNTNSGTIQTLTAHC